MCKPDFLKLTKSVHTLNIKIITYLHKLNTLVVQCEFPEIDKVLHEIHAANII